MTQIFDPLRANGARVTEDGELLVIAITEPEGEFVSHEKGLAFHVASTYSLTGGQEAISLQNDNADLDIIVEDIVVSTAASGVVTVFEVTSGTPAGTTVTPHNLNLGSSVVAQATAFGDASVTGSLSGTTIAAHDISTSVPFDFKFGGKLIIPKNSIIAVTFAETAIVFVNIIFHYSATLQY